MKKTIAIASCAVLVALVGCSSSDSEGPVVTPTPDVQAESQAEATVEAALEASQETGAEASIEAALEAEASLPDAPTEAQTDGEAGILQPAGGVCTKNNECSTKYCYGVFAGVANKYCTKACKVDGDCSTLGEGYEWGCVKSVCMKTCTSGDSSQCQEGGCIEKVELGGKITNLCFDLQGKTCTKAADCPTGSVCQVGTGGKDYFWYCNDNPWGTLAAGEACDQNVDYDQPCTASTDCGGGDYICGTNNTCTLPAEKQCAGAYCHSSGVCGGPCAADADCPTDFVCAGFYWFVQHNDEDSNNDTLALIHECIPFAGSRKACTRDADCSTGERCTWKPDAQGKLEQACRKPPANAIPDGEVCADLWVTTGVREPTKECQSGWCIYGRCTAACATAADCKAEEQCSELYVWTQQQTAKLCMPKACEKDSDCEAGKICNGEGGTPGAPVYACVDNLGGLAQGQACDPTIAGKAVTCINDSACTTFGAGWTCDTRLHTCTAPASDRCASANCWAAGFCGGSCATDTDCGDPTQWTCALFPVFKYNNDTGDPTDDLFGQVKFCEYVAGSGTACTKDADCTAASESCHALWTATGAIATKCGIDPAFAKGSGEPCDAAVICKGVCDYNDGDGDTSTGTCSSPCALDTDCTNGLVCKDLDLTTDGKHKIKSCRKQAAGGFSG